MTVQINLKDKSLDDLHTKQKELIEQTRAIDSQILRGSLIERYIRCGKPNCKCATGKGHGPKYYLSVSYPGRRPEQQYVPQDNQEKVREYLNNYQMLHQLLEEISRINREILRRREKL